MGALTGCKSVMIARGAQWNVSVFDKQNKLQSLDKIIEEYIALSEEYDNIFANSKYVIVKMVCGKRWLCKSDVSDTFMKVKNWKDCYAANKLLKAALDKRRNGDYHSEDADGAVYTDPSVFTSL